MFAAVVPIPIEGLDKNVHIRFEPGGIQHLIVEDHSFGVTDSANLCRILDHCFVCPVLA